MRSWPEMRVARGGAGESEEENKVGRGMTRTGQETQHWATAQDTGCVPQWPLQSILWEWHPARGLSLGPGGTATPGVPGQTGVCGMGEATKPSETRGKGQGKDRHQ